LNQFAPIGQSSQIIFPRNAPNQKVPFLDFMISRDKSPSSIFPEDVTPEVVLETIDKPEKQLHRND
jgi:hypothetical protein